MPDATTGYVLVVGPDGAGKSTVVDAIAECAALCGVAVSRSHYRPHLLFGRSIGGAPVTNPHAEPARSPLLALAKLGVVLGDHVLGYLVRWRTQRRAGLLLVERGWFDMAVDPRRYRLPKRWAPALRLVGRVLPRPDVVLMLSGDPQALYARKPEIGVEEVQRQISCWRELGPDAGQRVLEVDTVHTTPDQVAEKVFTALARRKNGDQPWRAVPLTPGRLALRISGRGRPALALYQPQSLRARAGAAVARHARVRGRRVAPPVPQLGDLWAVLGFRPDGLVAMDSSTRGRMVIAVSRVSRMEAVVKVGLIDDHALRQEAQMLSTPLEAGLPVGRPEVLWSGEWNDRFVLATRAVQRIGSAAWSAAEVVPLVQALSAAGPNGAPVTHGDLAPWNLVRTAAGPVLLDWESARFADEPLHDIAHFVVQGGALLGRYTPTRAVDLLCAKGSPGSESLRASGRTPDEAVPLLANYLVTATPTDPRAIRFRAEMLRLIGV